MSEIRGNAQGREIVALHPLCERLQLVLCCGGPIADRPEICGPTRKPACPAPRWRTSMALADRHFEPLAWQGLEYAPPTEPQRKWQASYRQVRCSPTHLCWTTLRADS